MRESISNMKINQLVALYPYVEDFFSSLEMSIDGQDVCLEAYIAGLEEETLQELGMEKAQIVDHLCNFIHHMEELRVGGKSAIHSISILGGYDKKGNRENVDRLDLKTGEILCIVGPTGSGKSRLLADIEWLAQKDTPTKRQLLINGKEPDLDKRFSVEDKLVAQLSQNMNFVMDLSVGEFVRMHAESRMVKNIAEVIEVVLEKANELAGESFSVDTPITSLSGGQSRALMIADTACLSSSPIVLIDEIENAGVDRKKALDLLVKKEKIVLMATHDPILALMGDRRLVIQNGGMDRVIETTDAEKKNLITLQKIDAKLLELRNLLRTGGRIDFDLSQYL